MEITKIETLDRYFKTENEHWNEFAFKTLQKALESEMFSDFIPLMDLYECSIAIASKTHREKPFEGLQLIIAECDKNEFNIQQKIFLLERVFEYLDQTEFENLESTKSEFWYSSEIQNLIKSQNEVYNKELKTTLPEYNKPLVGNINSLLNEPYSLVFNATDVTISRLTLYKVTSTNSFATTSDLFFRLLSTIPL